MDSGKPFDRDSGEDAPERAVEASHSGTSRLLLSDSTGRASKYQLLSRLGSGGMAEVYLALVSGPSGFNKLQVLKIMRTDVDTEDREDFLQMFEDEARLAARLNHPNIVQSHEVGFESGHPFLAMEYLDGQSLFRIQKRAWGRDEPFPLAMQIHVLCQVLEALEYAHGLTDYDGTPLQIVHRDVSPQNVFVTYAGHTKLVDFGIAKTLQSSKTRAGVVKGKAAYMAPEQVTGQPVDARTDLFSVGVMLWEALASQPMHGDSSVYQIMHQVVAGELPAIRDAVPDVPPALAAVLERALSVKPEDRYESAAAFRNDLHAYLDGLPRVRGRAVGEWVADLFESERASIHEVIRCAMAGESLPDLEDGPFVSTRRLPPFEPGQSEARRLTGASGGAGTGFAATEPAPEASDTGDAAAARRAPSRWPVAAGALLLAAAAFALWPRPPGPASDVASAIGAPAASHTAAVPDVATRAPLDTSEVTEVTGAVEAPAADRSASALPPSLVRVRIDVKPRAAQLELDGKPVKNPYSRSVPADQADHRLVASLPGYKPAERAFALMEDVSVALELKPERQPEPESDRMREKRRGEAARRREARATGEKLAAKSGAKPPARAAAEPGPEPSADPQPFTEEVEPFKPFPSPPQRSKRLRQAPKLDRSDPW